MHHQANIIFICDNVALCDAVLIPLSSEFNTKSAMYTPEISISKWVEVQGYHDVWILDDGFLKTSDFITEIIKQYADMGGKIIILGDNNLSNDMVYHLQKPVHIMDLKQVLRDSQKKSEKYKKPILLKDNLYIYAVDNCLCRGDVCMDITDKECTLLLYLITKGDIGAYRDDILWHVWGQKNDLDSHTLETHVSALRSKIENKFYIENTIIFKDKVYKIDKP